MKLVNNHPTSLFENLPADPADAAATLVARVVKPVAEAWAAIPRHPSYRDPSAAMTTALADLGPNVAALAVHAVASPLAGVDPATHLLVDAVTGTVLAPAAVYLVPVEGLDLEEVCSDTEAAHAACRERGRPLFPEEG